MKIKVFLLVCVICLTPITFLKTGKAERHSIVSTQDLSIHPIYSNYKFSNTEDVVSFGIQPIYSPTGLITETMKRDAFLRNALSESGFKAEFYSRLGANSFKEVSK